MKNGVLSKKNILLFMLMGLNATAFAQRLTVKDLMDCLSLEKTKASTFMVKKGYHATTDLLFDNIPENCKDYQVYASDKKETPYSFIAFNCAAKGVEARTPLKGDFDRYKTELVAAGFQMYATLMPEGNHVSGELTKNDYVYTCHLVTRASDMGNTYYVTITLRKK